MRPLTTIRSIGLLAAGAMLIAACGGNAATTAPTQAAATSAPVTTEGPGATTPGASFAMPSFHGDTDLEDMIPKEVAGEALTVMSMTGDQFLGDGSSSPELAGALQDLGKTTTDLSVGFAGNSKISIVAFRVKGVAADQLFNAFKAAETDEFTSENVSYGGKSIVKLVPADGSTAFIYLKDDTMFVVGGAGAGNTLPTDAVLNEAFSKLP